MPTDAAIESGRKQPTVMTLDCLLHAAGTELVAAPPDQAALLRRARRLEGVLGLAEALPFRRERALRFPPDPDVTTLVEKVLSSRAS